MLERFNLRFDVEEGGFPPFDVALVEFLGVDSFGRLNAISDDFSRANINYLLIQGLSERPAFRLE